MVAARRACAACSLGWDIQQINTLLCQPSYASPHRLHRQGTLHYGGEWPANAYTTAYYQLPGGASFADDWHTFRLDWTKKQVGAAGRRFSGC